MRIFRIYEDVSGNLDVFVKGQDETDADYMKVGTVNFELRYSGHNIYTLLAGLGVRNLTGDEAMQAGKELVWPRRW